MAFPKSLILVYATAFIDQLGYSFILPVIPYYTDALHGTSFELGILIASYAFTQAISALVMGSLSDRFGRRPFIILSLFGSLTGPILQAISSTMWQFIFSRAYTGLFAGSVTLGQAYIADLIPSNKRTRFMSQLGGIISVAFVFGPAVGGFLSEISLETPFYVAGGVAGIVFILAIFLLQESLPAVIEKKTLKKEMKQLLRNHNSEESKKRLEAIKQKEEEKKKLQDIEKQKKNNKKEHVHWNIYMYLALAARFILDSDCIIFDSMYGKYIKDNLNSTTMDFSLILCTTGILCSLVCLWWFPSLNEKYHIASSTLASYGSILLVLGYIWMTYGTSLLESYFSCNIMFIGYAFIYPLPPAILSAQATPNTQGTVLSTGVMVGEFAMICMPPLMGYIYDISSTISILTGAFLGLICVICMFLLDCIPGGRSADLQKDDSKEDSKDNVNDVSKDEKEDTLKEEKNISDPNEIVCETSKATTPAIQQLDSIISESPLMNNPETTQSTKQDNIGSNIM
ncbi:hypothetical protein WA158_005982 [Blastocystis sp. Blastoise]